MAYTTRHAYALTRHRGSTLTDAECDIMRLLAEGRSTKEVANERNVVVNTIKSQLRTIHQKVGVKHRGALIIYAQRHGYASSAFAREVRDEQAQA